MQSSDTAAGIRVNCLYHIFSQKWNARDKQVLIFNPIWTGLFENLRHFAPPPSPPPNLVISSQMMMKFGKDILWLEIFTN